jgi:alkane 1-monooxygenase
MNWKALKYLLPFVFFVLAYFAMHQTCWVVFLPVLAAFVVVPILELLFKPNATNLSDAEETMAKADPVYDWILYLVVPLQFITLYWFLSGITDVSLHWWEVAGRVASMSLMCGTFGINVAHELGHRNTRHEQWIAKALLLTSLYSHFFIEHNKGHHKHVSTPRRP